MIGKEVRQLVPGVNILGLVVVILDLSALERFIREIPQGDFIILVKTGFFLVLADLILCLILHFIGIGAVQKLVFSEKEASTPADTENEVFLVKV